MQVCDVGGGTGFCTLGVVETVRPENITLVDQSPHQLTKAKAKPALQKVTITEVYTLAAAGVYCASSSFVFHACRLPLILHLHLLTVIHTVSSTYMLLCRVMQRIYPCLQMGLTGMYQQAALSIGQTHSVASGKRTES